MAKLNDIVKGRRHSRIRHARFYTSVDMSIVKHDDAVRNSRIKRGEMKRSKVEAIFCCGCGVEGCFFHSTLNA